MVFNCLCCCHSSQKSLFCFYQQKSFESTVKFRQAGNCSKRVLEAAKLAYANKTKSLSLSRNLVLGTFSKFLTVFSTKINLLTVRRCCLLFSRNSNLDESGIS